MSLTIDNESFAITNNGKSFEILKDNASLDRNSERVYMNGFWWDLEKATADGYASLDDLYNTLRDKIDHRYTSSVGDGAITSAEIISALGYTPYSSANPTGFITASSLVGLATEAYVNAQGFLISSDLTPYLTITSASTTYYPLSGNPSGFITASALSPYLLSTTASTTYQPILISGTNLKTINGSSLLGSGDITISGGSSSISGLTAATANNTINNGAYSQEWQFNSLANGTGLKLSSNSTLASSNTQSIFEVANSGANANASQTTYGARFFNTKTGGSSTNIGAFFSASGANNNFAIEAQNRIKVSNSGSGISDISFWSSGGENARIGTGYNNLVDDNLEINQLKNMGIVFKINNTEKMRIGASGYLGIGETTPSFPLTISTNVAGFGIYLNSRILCDNTANSYQYTATSNGNSAQFGCATNANTAVISASGSPILYVSNNNHNVGIGVATPNASAKLEVVSTTQGFLPPRMTASQASAIVSPAKSLIVYVTDTNGTFTSAGIWIYTTSWKLILAE